MQSTVEKACEIRNAEISFVSLVDKAANKRQFLITKAEKGQADFRTYGRIIKTDSENHYVTGVVYEPMVEDAHGDFMTEEEITKAAHWFAKNGNNVDLQHSFEPLDGAKVVENWIAKADYELDGEQIRKGTWLITVEVSDPGVWERIEKGEITGFSMGGHGVYSGEDVDLDAVAKGAVSEIYDDRSQGTLFWNAFDALQECLRGYDFYSDKTVFESDETRIKECLADFSAIITDILTGESSIVKTLSDAEHLLEKSGRKMSSRNKETLSSIYESLGEFLKEFEDPEPDEETTDKEDSIMTKREVEKLIQEGIAKALKETETPTKTAADNIKKSAEVTPDFITSAVEAAIAKALAPKQETMTAEQVQQMVAEAVEKAVEPILRRTGTPSNLNDIKNIEKQAETHYLHGIL